MSNSDKRSKVPDPPTPPAPSGNMLSSVAPPSQLPNFVMASSAPSPVKLASQANVAAPIAITTTTVPPSQASSATHSAQQSASAPVQNALPITPLTPDKFSPVIPLSKGEPTVPIRSPDDSQATQSPDDSLEASTPELDKIGDIMPGSGLFTWVKGAVSSGGILHKVAEKAKSSVDSMIYTLDPQMKEYLNSGGDISVVVASDKEVKIAPLREAFQAVFGKATVVGYPAASEVTAVQPVGCAAAYAAAKQRIADVRSKRADISNNTPVVAVEGYLHEAIADRWYEISLLVLSQPSLGIELQLQSQGTPVPLAAVLAAREATPPDYAHKQTGYTTTIGAIMATNLKVSHTQWQEACTGVTRKQLLLLAARALAGTYKRMLAISAAEV